MRKKFIHEDGHVIAHCPTCRGVLFRTKKIETGKENCRVELQMRCPHCEAGVRTLLCVTKDKQWIHVVGIIPMESVKKAIDDNIAPMQ